MCTNNLYDPTRSTRAVGEGVFTLVHDKHRGHAPRCVWVNALPSDDLFRNLLNEAHRPQQRLVRRACTTCIYSVHTYQGEAPCGGIKNSPAGCGVCGVFGYGLQQYIVSTYNIRVIRYEVQHYTYFALMALLSHDKDFKILVLVLIGVQDSIRADQASYLKQHPEISSLLNGFIRAVVERKPADVYEFARQHFAGDAGDG